MLQSIPYPEYAIPVGAFVAGFIFAKMIAFFGNRAGTGRDDRDPRDSQVRSLEAELRIAKSELEKSQETLEEREKELDEAAQQNSHVDAHIKKQDEIIQSLRNDLKDSVKKTRELRSELSNRATENLKSEARLRETQTELSVAQASHDLIATGVLDYSAAPGNEEPEEGPTIQQAKR